MNYCPQSCKQVYYKGAHNMEETGGNMPSEREFFNLSGPLHLSATDWTSPDHRRSIAASLVQGVYILERDRQQNRQGPQALAPPWWDFFHFQLIRVLVDDKDLSIFGAVYEFKYPPYNNFPSHNPPRYVIAFRGTVTKPDTRSLDLKLDFHYIFNRLQQSPRFEISMRCVQEFASLAGPQNIWLAGHSLGSALALSSGKNMVKSSGSCIETYLFNPPFTSAPLEKIKSSKIKHGIRFANSVVTAGVAVAINGLKQNNQRDEKRSSFSMLSKWVPFMFVNQSDPICSEYIGYFEHRLKMMAIGDGSMGRLATQNSIGSLLSGKNSEPDHLLPSTYLGINMSPSETFKKAHGIHQWWNPDIQCEFKLHQYM